MTQHIPLAPIFAVQSFGPWYFVTWCRPAQGGEPKSEGWYPREMASASSRDITIKDIVEQQFDDLDKIYCAQDARFFDATRDFAEEVLHHFSAGRETPSDQLRTWLEETLGVGAVARHFPIPLEA